MVVGIELILASISKIEGIRHVMIKCKTIWHLNCDECSLDFLFQVDSVPVADVKDVPLTSVGNNAKGIHFSSIIASYPVLIASPSFFFLFFFC